MMIQIWVWNWVLLFGIKIWGLEFGIKNFESGLGIGIRDQDWGLRLWIRIIRDLGLESVTGDQDWRFELRIGDLDWGLGLLWDQVWGLVIRDQDWGLGLGIGIGDQDWGLGLGIGNKDWDWGLGL